MNTPKEINDNNYFEIKKTDKNQFEDNFILKIKQLIMDLILQKYNKVMVLKVFLDTESLRNEAHMSDEEVSILTQKYKEFAEKHNSNVLSSDHINAGFDLLLTKKMVSILCNTPINVMKANHYIKCAGHIYNDKKNYSTGYYLHPRSSIYKTSFRLANSTGIIDAGYRGHIISMLDVLNSNNEKHTCDDVFVNEEPIRLMQICGPDLCPIYVELVEYVEDLGKTERGEGGFGSTGR